MASRSHVDVNERRLRPIYGRNTLYLSVIEQKPNNFSKSYNRFTTQHVLSVTVSLYGALKIPKVYHFVLNSATFSPLEI